jgi:formate dehydrogenase subunit gamma
MQWIPEYRNDVPRVERFNFLARFTHWSHTVTFLLLLFTGLTLFLGPIPWLAAIFGGARGANWIHRVAALVMTVTLLTSAAVGYKGVFAWIKDLFRFGMNDIKFLMTFPLDFMGVPVKIPPQTRFNGGEKMNSVVLTTSVTVLVLSGWIIWWPSIWWPGLVRFSYWAHDLGMIVATFMVCMHGYLGSFHPGSGESFWGMWKGTVRTDWAQHHHATWYEETYGDKAKADAE